MKLLASLLTTAAITAAIWGGVVNQPAMAEKIVTETLAKTKETHPKESAYYLRPVVTRTVALDNVPSLWREFEKQLPLQENLPTSSDRFVALYKNFSSDFTQANVTIGVGLDQSESNNTSHELPSTSNKQQLLPRGQYSAEDLENAWQAINFTKPIEAVVETHYINLLGQEESSQLVVYYK